MADSIFLEVTIKSVHAPGPLFAVVPPGDQAVLTASLIGKVSKGVGWWTSSRTRANGSCIIAFLFLSAELFDPAVSPFPGILLFDLARRQRPAVAILGSRVGADTKHGPDAQALPCRRASRGSWGEKRSVRAAASFSCWVCSCGSTRHRFHDAAHELGV